MSISMPSGFAELHCTAPACGEYGCMKATVAIATGWDIFRSLCPKHHVGYVPRRPPLCPLCPSRLPRLLGISYG